MKILVTGNLGYIGSVLSENLSKNYSITGLDSGLYDECFFSYPKNKITQINKDIRDIEENDLIGQDAIIHLAALSNDPLGEFDKSITREINYSATVRLAQLAKKSKIKRFIFSSSQSIYGIADENIEIDEYTDDINPVTEYAKSKIDSEKEIFKLADKDFVVVAFRPSTVFGSSPNLRCDIVFNNFLACGFTTKNIEIKSDGSPWRPAIHVIDVVKAFESGLTEDKEIINGKSYNIGILDGNYTIKRLADEAKKILPLCEVKFTKEHLVDPRSYKVSFRRIFNDLKSYKPEWTLYNGGVDLINFFKTNNFSENDFRGYKTNRLLALKKKILEKKIDTNLRKINE